MGIIKKLVATEAQKIAAGEVVERPYNIVKELVENSLDAGATTLTLYIQDGGKQLIRCIDNGMGMSPEDARLSLEHHATSKLTTIEDLETINTFGFRGEALSSISAIGKMTLSTQQHGQDYGTRLNVDAGLILTEETISQASGTDITIADIFFNIPARKKFLKTRETEWRGIYTLVQALALAHPEVTFKLYHDESLMLNTVATTRLEERIAQIFDASFSEHLLTCATQDTHNNYAISGALAHYQYQRYDRNQQFFFVNKRWIKNYQISKAFMKGFQNVLPPGKYPAGVIFITLPTSHVDINVHPRKEEVVFLQPRTIERMLQDMVYNRLQEETASRITPSYAFPPLTLSSVEGSRASLISLHSPPLPTLPSPFPSTGPGGQEETFTSKTVIQPPYVQQTVIAPKREDSPQLPAFTIIGQLLKTYLLLETDQGLTIVDQHAAHEAVLYEQFSSNMHDVARVQLLFPEVVPLSAESQKAALAHLPELNKMGIHLESAGPNTLAITETPVFLKNYPLADLVHDILSWASEGSVAQAALTKKLHAMMACKAAVKAGDVLTHQEIEELLKSLYTTKQRLTCPHGRPTLWTITQYELEKTFKRKV